MAADPKHNPERNPAVLIEVTRGPIVESWHHGVIAVCDPDGNLLAWAGNPGVVSNGLVERRYPLCRWVGVFRRENLARAKGIVRQENAARLQTLHAQVEHFERSIRPVELRQYIE